MQLEPSSAQAYSESFQFDGFGNLTAKVLNNNTTPIAVSGATNQLANGSYDLNGNMTSGAGATLTYDGANRLISAAEVSGGMEYYGYGADNQRMYKLKANGTEEWTFYGAFGEKLGVFQYSATAGPYGGFVPVRATISFAGRMVVDEGNAVFRDRLGTNRANGARYYPYGEEITSTGNDQVKFATYTRDGYTGLDYADQRFYASTYGRFNTPDPYIASASGGNDTRTPQSWNRYAYVQGDPINSFDPSGQYPCGSTLAYSSGGVISTTVYDCPDLLPTDVPQVALSYKPLTIQQWDDVHPAPCPPVPNAPAGVSVDQNAQDAINFVATLGGLTKAQVDLAKAAYLVANFAPGASEDYKSQYGDAYREFGNFNYGAVAEAIGVPSTTIVAGAGLASTLNFLLHGAAPPSSWGNVLTGPPYGDNPGEQMRFVEA